MTDSAAVTARDRLILALDVPDIDSGIEVLDKLKGEIGLVKIGLELFTACGPPAVKAVKDRDFKVFLDLKLHDIPNTVQGAVRAALGLGVDMLTVHTSGGEKMLTAAAAAAENQITILGVTLLTSLGPEDLPPICVDGSPSEIVEKRAALAAKTRCGGAVCSPKEIRVVREAIGPNMAIVTPGIRPGGADLQDQKRSATPAQAIANGADYLVVGRPILKADDPRSAAADIVTQIEQGLLSR